MQMRRLSQSLLACTAVLSLLFAGDAKGQVNRFGEAQRLRMLIAQVEQEIR